MTGLRPLVRPCPPEAIEAALEVLYQRLPAPLRDHLIAEVLQEAARGQIDLSGLWVAQAQPWKVGPARSQGQGRKPPRILGALLTQALVGRVAAVWAPEVRPSLRRGATAATLVRTALDDLRARGFRLAQAVLDESASHRSAADLVRGGMPRVTELVYLERDTAIPLPPFQASGQGRISFKKKILHSGSGPGASPPRLDWRGFDPAREDEFRAILVATYRDSLDMPELDGVRSLNDILEGHRATGRFVPERWRIGRVPGEPDSAVVLLLAEIPDRDLWEVIYLGLTPPARGRGLGRAAIEHALELARPHVPRLELAVDVRNLPAMRLYESTGFVPFDRRSVHLVVFPEITA